MQNILRKNNSKNDEKDEIWIFPQPTLNIEHKKKRREKKTYF